MTFQSESSYHSYGGSAHGILYDYGGFPPNTYQLKYPAPGNPVLAQTAQRLLKDHGFTTAENSIRGYDHGVFIPLMLMYPGNERNFQLLHWTQGQGARLAHPDEDHLIPLMVAVGAAENDRGQKIFSDLIMGVQMSAYRFG